MFNETSGIVKAVLAVMFFPLFFQDTVVNFAWGAADQMWLMVGKRTFLLLPAMAFILGCWASIACLLTVVIRQNRRKFLTALLITWWDLGRSIVQFWGGVLNFLFRLAFAIVALAKILVVGVWSLVQEVLFLPFRMFRNMGQNVLSSPIPWIAVGLTIFWCVVEAFIFTYVTSPLVLDVFSNITGEYLNVNLVRIPLYIFLLFIVLGSYAVLSTFVESFKGKNYSAILGIGAIESVVLFVEVVFLYREFVDALVPWFAQYSQNFELGVVGTLSIAAFVWFGIRSISWFLFAAHGTPTILNMIQGKGMAILHTTALQSSSRVNTSPEFVDKIKAEAAWFQTKSEELLESFMLPPLQLVAASINFCTLLLNSKHLFELPFKSLSLVADSKELFGNVRQTVVRTPTPRKKEQKQEQERERQPIGEYEHV